MRNKHVYFHFQVVILKKISLMKNLNYNSSSCILYITTSELLMKLLLRKSQKTITFDFRINHYNYFALLFCSGNRRFLTPGKNPYLNNPYNLLPAITEITGNTFSHTAIHLIKNPYIFLIYQYSLACAAGCWKS